jgi:hypothetical protein
MWTITASELSELLQITRRLQEQQAWSGLDRRNPVETEIDRLSYPEQLERLAKAIRDHFPELSPQINAVKRSRRGKRTDWPAQQISRIATLHGELLQRFIEGDRRKLFALKLTTPCPKCHGKRLAENEGRLCDKCLSWDGKMVSIWMALKRAAFEKLEWTDETGLSTRKVADEWRTLKRLADEVFERKFSDRELFDEIRDLMMHGEELNTFLDTSINDVETFLRSRSREQSAHKDQDQTRPEATTAPIPLV